MDVSFVLLLVTNCDLFCEVSNQNNNFVFALLVVLKRKWVDSGAF